MVKKVQSFFLFFKKKSIIYFIVLNILNNNIYADWFGINKNCFNYNIYPNFTLFQQSLVRATLFQPTCNKLSIIEKQYPMIIDGMSFFTNIFIPINCQFKKKLNDAHIQKLYNHIKLWDYTHNLYVPYWIKYQITDFCGLVIIPKYPLLDSSYYLLIFPKKAFVNLLENYQMQNLDIMWDNFKKEYLLKNLNKEQEEFIKTVLDVYLQNHPLNPDEFIYSIFPVRSYSGIFAPMIYYRDIRKNHIVIDLIKKWDITRDYKFDQDKVFRFLFKEKLISLHEESLKIYYMGIENTYPIQLDYKNYLTIYIPGSLNTKIVNVLFTNRNLLSASYIRKLANETNSVIISYYIFKDKYLNFINDIFIYDNLTYILSQFDLTINKIIKFCISDIECLIGTFYQETIEKVIIYDYPDSIIEIYNSNKEMYNTVLSSYKIVPEEIISFYANQLKEDLFQLYLYHKNKDKLMHILNYKFQFYKISNGMNFLEYIKIKKIFEE